MKIRRILGLFMALMMVASLCACAGGTKDVDLADALKSINKEFSISEDSMIMIEDTDTLELYYNVSAADVKQFAAETTMNSSSDVTEIVLIEAVDETAAKNVCDALTVRYNAQRDLCSSYSPELLAVVEKSAVTQNGNYVSLIIIDNYDDVAGHYNSMFE